MDTPRFYSDRVLGPTPRRAEVLPLATKAGLLSLFTNKIEANWFAAAFPENCHDGNGVTGTNIDALRANVEAVVPGAAWPLRDASKCDDDAVLDLMEYACDYVAYAKQDKFHSFFGHWELSFDARKGQSQFRSEVNRILQRGGTVFELTGQNVVERRGAPETMHALSALQEPSGDTQLDRLIEQGRSMYLSHRADQRELARERMWDAFERLKTLEPGNNKPEQIAALLSHISSEEFRAVVDRDMRALTDLGNNFEIRHRETNRFPIPVDASDYVIGRMAQLMGYLLKLRNGAGPT